MGNRTIPQIDKDITALQRKLRRLEVVRPLDAASAQAAWDKHPDLRDQERALFRERGEAQLARAIREEELAKKARWTAARSGKRCPACNGSGRITKQAA